MVHIATVHIKSPRWIPVQARELRRNMSSSYRVWGCLEGVDRSYDSYFDCVIEHGGGHAAKLNRLAMEIAEKADDDDLVMFLDGDAFPIADPSHLIASSLVEAPLLAVRRAENCGEPHPHPCFCVTRVVTWRELPGDWAPGGRTWMGPEGKPVTGVGAELLCRLEAAGMRWIEILRSNRFDLHPVLFGVYGDLVYHHGAGFRMPVTRADLDLLKCRPTLEDPVARDALERNTRESKAMFDRIARDEFGWLAELVQPP